MLPKKINFENLDGLRFFCFLSVFFFHSFPTQSEEVRNSETYKFFKFEIFGNGNLGVNFFFVLSGFLITYLLIAEKKEFGQINIGKFWIRRILRIWPLYFFCVFFGFVIFPQIKSLFGQSGSETASLLHYLTFTSNFDLIHNRPDSSVISILWSVAIEEQFYLIWPVILYLLPIRHYWIAFVLVISGSLIFRWLSDSYILHEVHTLSCIGDMAVGAFGAWLIFTNRNFRNLIESLPRKIIFLMYASLVIVFFFRDELLFSNHYIRTFERLLIAFIIILVILEQNFSKNSFYKISSFKKISTLGIITYGLYCLHSLSILIAYFVVMKTGIKDSVIATIIISTPFSLVITIILAKLSYRYYERPFLSFKNRFAFFTKN